jgi:HSP90 family molecular chaperone
MLSLVTKGNRILKPVAQQLLSISSHLNQPNKRYYSSDFKEIKPDENKIDPELDAMIKNDQANLESDEQLEKENKVEENPDVLIPENETPVGEPVTREFQAETKKILDIVARSLYSDKEIFIRELISNASDALEKVRHLMSVNSDVVDTHLPLEIHISCDEEKKTFTVQDFGVGMTRDELIQNLGKIGFSGTGEFAKILEDADRKKNLIGHFGVGFYSAFMVGTTVRVYSKGCKEEGDIGHIWESDGSGAYKLTEAKGVSRGTKIVIQLRQESEEFSVKKTVENIIKTYSNFVGFPIFLNGKPVNTITAIWVKQPQTVTEQEHKDFYQFIAKAYDAPKYVLHFMTDMPLQLQALFYVPETHMEKYGMGRQEVGVSLFCRKVMIQSKCKGLLPDWLRFVKGIVDSEDVPLNISREHLQDSALIKRLSGVLTRRLVKFFEKEMKTNADKYDKFYSEFGQFLKEGICTDYVHKEEIAKLLRIESSHLAAGKLTTIDEYIERMPKERSEIYYLIVPNRNFAESSPYFESFKAKDVEVLFLYDTRLDDFVFSNLAEFKGKKTEDN